MASSPHVGFCRRSTICFHSHASLGISVGIIINCSRGCFFLFWTGLQFIGRNFSVAVYEQVNSPIGFNITFTGLLSLATDICLEFHIIQTNFCGILHGYSIIQLVSNIQLVCQFGGFNLHILLPCFGEYY